MKNFIPSRISLNFIWFDFWIGLFWDRHSHTLYIGMLPTIIVKVEF